MNFVIVETVAAVLFGICILLVAFVFTGKTLIRVFLKETCVFVTAVSGFILIVNPFVAFIDWLIK